MEQRCDGRGYAQMIVVNNLKLRPGESEKKLQKMAAQALKIKVEDFTSFEIFKKSLDARRKNDIHFVYAVSLTVKGDEQAIAGRCKQAVVKPAFSSLLHCTGVLAESRDPYHNR